MGLIISVSGIRGIVGKDLMVQDALKVGMLFGDILGEGRDKVVLAGDSRVSGPALRSAVSAGLMAVGKDVVDLGVVTTPGACLMVRKLQVCGGCIVTASHNPFEWNGIKLIGPDGLSFDAERAKLIKERFYKDLPKHRLADRCGRIERNDQTHTVHIQAVIDSMDKELLERIRERKFRVVLDSVNGAGCVGTAMLLKELGCELIHINSEPTGLFAHTPEPIAENLTQLCEAVKREGADVGFAQDPDADRLAIVDENGNFVGEEYTLVLASWFVLKKTPGPVAVNLSTSRMIEDLAYQFGQEVIRTPVGEANVARAVIENNCPIGGEGNGGVIFPRVVPVRDSFAGIGLILQLMIDTERRVSELIRELPSYSMIKRKFRIDLEKAGEIILGLKEKYKQFKINTADGLRIDFEDERSWVHIRRSNTEPIIRIIAESPSADRSAELIDMLAKDVGVVD